jgi:segregation and condensation protein A
MGWGVCSREGGGAPPEVSLHDLQLAWLKIARQARLKRHHTIQREEMSVREHMTLILRQAE